MIGGCWNLKELCLNDRIYKLCCFLLGCCLTCQKSRVCGVVGRGDLMCTVVWVELLAVWVDMWLFGLISGCLG